SSDAEIFTKSDNVKEIYQYICLKKKIKVDERKRTLLFIDEIQNEPKAVGLLRYFYEEMPWLHIIAAGSRLQTLIKQRISFP
ncbi:AAA family ATPase, partial [Acinetobacter baumannii]